MLGKKALVMALSIAIIISSSVGYYAYAYLTDSFLLNIQVLDAENKGAETYFYVFMIHPEGPSSIIAYGKTDIYGKASIKLSVNKLTSEWRGFKGVSMVKPFLQVDVLAYGKNVSDFRASSFVYDPATLRGPTSKSVMIKLGIKAERISTNPSSEVEYLGGNVAHAQYPVPVLVNFDDSWRWIRLAQISTDSRTSANIDVQIYVSQTFQSGVFITDSISGQFQLIDGTSITTTKSGFVNSIASRSSTAYASMRARLVWEEWMIPDLVYGVRYEERFYYKDIDPSTLTTAFYPIYISDLSYFTEAIATGQGHVDDRSIDYRAWWKIYMSSVTTEYYGVSIPSDLASIILSATEVPSFVTFILPKVSYIADKQSASVNTAVDVSVWGDNGVTIYIKRAKYTDAEVETVYMKLNT